MGVCQRKFRHIWEMRLLITVADHTFITAYPSKSSNHGYALSTRQIPIVVKKKPHSCCAALKRVLPPISAA